MADEADNADLTIAQALSFQLAAAKHGPKIDATGFCLQCDEADHSDGAPMGVRRWCSVACRDDWQKGRPR